MGHLALDVVALPAALRFGLLLALGAALLAPGAQASPLVGAAREVGRCLLQPTMAALLGLDSHLDILSWISAPQDLRVASAGPVLFPDCCCE